MADSRNPELQRLLDSLSSYTPQKQTHNGNLASYGRISSSHTVPTSTRSPQAIAIPGLGLLPLEQSYQAHPSPDSLAHLHNPPTSKPSEVLKSSHKSTAPMEKPSIPDASAITTWPAALKHVTKYLAPDETFANRIRHLISAQHNHERQWHEGRLALISMQSSRSSTSAQVSALLQSIGGKSVQAKASDAESNENELEAYDKKVYAGLLAMAADFDRQLRNLGVPFYAIQHDLVILEGGLQKPVMPKGRIDRGELREFQKKMLELLEDLFGE